MKTKVKVREWTEGWVFCYTEKWRFKLHPITIYFISDLPGESDKCYTVYRQSLRKKTEYYNKPFHQLDLFAENICYDKSQRRNEDKS